MSLTRLSVNLTIEMQRYARTIDAVNEIISAFERLKSAVNSRQYEIIRKSIRSVAITPQNVAQTPRGLQKKPFVLARSSPFSM